jgi:hypothetical protein
MTCNSIFPLYTVDKINDENAEKKYRDKINIFWQDVNDRVGGGRISQHANFSNYPSVGMQCQWKLLIHFILLSIQAFVSNSVKIHYSKIPQNTIVFVSRLNPEIQIHGSKDLHLKLLPHYLTMLHYMFTDKISSLSSNVAQASQVRGYEEIIEYFFVLCDFFFRSAESYFNCYVNLSELEYYSFFLGKEFVLVVMCI